MRRSNLRGFNFQHSNRMTGLCVYIHFLKQPTANSLFLSQMLVYIFFCPKDIWFWKGLLITFLVISCPILIYLLEKNG